jgi:hypothetical protein
MMRAAVVKLAGLLMRPFECAMHPQWAELMGHWRQGAIADQIPLDCIDYDFQMVDFSVAN